MDDPKDNMDVRQQLIDVIERWYVWLTSNPSSLFGSDDFRQMETPVSQFAQTCEWLNQSIIHHVNFFFERGSQIATERLQKGDYDAYD